MSGPRPRREKPSGSLQHSCGTAGIGAPRARRRGDDGTTLIEVVVCLALLALLGAVVFPLVATFTSVSTSIQGTYDTVDHLMEPSIVLSRLLHEAVAPAPPGSSAPWSVFTSNSGPAEGTKPLEMQFTADVGPYGTLSDAGHFTAYGPALVTVAVQSGPGGRPALTGTIAPAVADTCPGLATGSGSACQWQAIPIQLFSIPDFSSSGTVFDYVETGGTVTATPAASPCTDVSDQVSCPLDQVTAVQFTFQSQRYAALSGNSMSEAALLAPAYDPSLG